MTSSAAPDIYMQVLGSALRESSNHADGASSHEENKVYELGFEDIAEIQDTFLEDSSASENEVIKTDQLRLRPRQKRRYKKFDNLSFVLRRKFKLHGNSLHRQGMRLEIQSDELRAHLRDILADKYEDIDWDDESVRIDHPYQVFFHGRDEIKNSIDREEQKEKSDELRLLYNFLQDECLKKTLQDYQRHVPKGCIIFDILWTIYVPKKVLIFKEDHVIQCYRCVKVSNVQTSESGERHYKVTVGAVDYDGERIGTTETDIYVKAFQGVRHINALELAPLDSHKDAAEIRNLMKQRHRQFHMLIKAQHSHKYYNGIAWIPMERSPYAQGKPQLQAGFHVRGRIVIDYEAYLDYNPDERSLFDRSKYQEDSEDKADDDQALLCTARIPGFSLLDRRWAWFLIDEASLKDIEWKPDPFQYLRLQEDKKSIIAHLVKGHLEGGGFDFEDLVAGKGKGLLILLSGPPGMECISEHVRRPLYRITAGGLTIDVSNLEKEIRRIFELGTRWNAILLLDEADVLMCQRKAGAVEMNSVVAAFLQVLEYYEGILFLTSNKPNEFDPAVKDRIHLEVALGDITAEDRRAIWRNLIQNIPGQAGRDEIWTDEIYNTLSAVEVNGREIKNILRMATCYATGEGNPFGPSHLAMVVRAKTEKGHGLENLKF
ncbi:AAA family ATPase [Fusarium pseudocircinatum]|uniref:AAA family ATPase n=1 Tax=Fusarium pseudocircinatum TaxID=56676 RepID=A0A8H5LAZ7_9HYPO|nr:AAA family ATPase [Fusarium pseudocircinatum]